MKYVKLDTSDGPSGRLAEISVLMRSALTSTLLSRHFDTLDLLTSQRVCRKWQAVIKSNINLQQNLLKTPTTIGQRWLYDGPYNIGNTAGTKTEDWVYLDLAEPSVTEHRKIKDEAVVSVATLHPCLVLHNSSGPLPAADETWVEFGNDLDFVNRDAPWRAMYFSKPLPTEIKVRVCGCRTPRACWKRRPEWCYCEGRATFSGSMTVGEVMDELDGSAMTIPEDDDVNWRGCEFSLRGIVVPDSDLCRRVAAATAALRDEKAAEAEGKESTT